MPHRANLQTIHLKKILGSQLIFFIYVEKTDFCIVTSTQIKDFYFILLHSFFKK